MGLDKFRRQFRIAGPLDVGGTAHFRDEVNLAVGGTISGTVVGTRADTGTTTGAHTFSGNIVLSGTPSLQGGLSGTATGAPTFSGNVAFSGTPALSGGLSGTASGAPTFSGNVVYSGTPNVSGQLNLGGSNITGRFRMPFNFFQGNIAATQTDVQIEAATWVSSGTAITSIQELPMPVAVTLREFAVYITAAASAGTATFVPTKNGADADLSGALTTGQGTVISGGTTTFAAGDRLGCEITTSADWNGTTADASVVVLVQPS